jgi:acyl transferase domain-containing protein/acyl carrier protein
MALSRNGGRHADDIAVIATQGRFPGARDVDALWSNLKAGVESITTFSDDELQAAGIDPAYVSVPGFVNRGCILEDIEQFDAEFFGYSARDAETMDPQQRVFIECAWQSLERAGYDPDAYPGTIGVFAGCDQSSYLYQIYNNVDLNAYGYGGMMAIGNEKDYLTTQTSYKLNLRGPSLDIQTSCSTSLVAVCIACQNLRHGYCDMALAGGVAISTPQKTGYWYQPGGIMSPDGHCRPFDANAQGTVVGNGVGIVLLKRASEAVRDGDNILAVIRGFGVNNDGAAKVGYTAPGIEGQSRAIEMAQRMAGVGPDTIGYIEAHGTATALGDPVEVAALTKAFRRGTDKRQFCAIGSLKSNVGHLSSAAGVSGLIKAILTVQHGEIPPSLHYQEANGQLDIANTPFFVASELSDWPVNHGPRRAGVSSFGVGGTNAHMVLEQAPAPKRPKKAARGRDTILILLSARTPSALEQATDNLVAELEAKPEHDLADVAFTLQAGRKPFPHRRAVVVGRDGRDDLRMTMAARDPDRVYTTHSEISDRPVVFLFSGQGTQYVDMGADLYRTEPTFRDHLDECSELLIDQIGLDLRTILYPDADGDAAEARLRDTAMTQPGLFALEYALAQLWMEWGVRPKAMVGHSIGEYVAACLAGVLSLEDALSVVAMRGRLMASMPAGNMLAVALPEAALQPVLRPDVSLAAVNAPAMSVLSGAIDVIDSLEKHFTDQGIACQKLHTSHAFHSSLMEPVVAQFVERIRRIDLRPPEMPYLSNLTGSWITPELATSPDYWGHHLRQTVRFADNLVEVMGFPDLALLEIGPGQTLGLLARQQGSRSSSQLILSSLPGAREKEQYSDSALMAWTLGQLWLGGVKLDWSGYHSHGKRRRVPLPTYPFERQRYWLGPLEGTPGAPTVEAPVAAQNGDGPRQSAAEAQPEVTQVAAAPAETPSDIADWTYVPVWRPAVKASPAAPPDAASESWLVFGDGVGLSAEIEQLLIAAGATVNVAVQGPAFHAGDGRWELRPDARADYDGLLQELKDRGEYPTRVLHLWSIDADGDESGVDGFDRAQKSSFYSLVFLSQALAKAGPTKAVQIGVATRTLHAVLGDEVVRSDEATALAACKVISQEYSNLRCRAVDLVLEDEGNGEALIGELLAEAFRPVVAYRKGRRWIETYESVSLEKPVGELRYISDEDVYLVTGGLGNIALLLVETIAADVKARFILTGRSAFPDRESWDGYLEQHSAGPTAEKIRRLMRLERDGCEVMVVQADAADRDQMQAAVGQAVERWGAVNGVIHAAANLAPDAFGSVADVDRVAGDGQFRPKAHGLLVTEEALRDQPVKFYVLLSSVSAILGGLGLACYAASNAYLDAAARRRSQDGGAAWITVDWDSWTFVPGTSNGDAITPPQGADCFRRIMASSLDHVVVSTTPLADRLARWVEFSAQGQAAAAPAPGIGANGGGIVASASGTGELHARPSLATPYASPGTDTEKAIAGVWEHLLGVGPVGVHDKFFELGGHSLLAVQLMDRLREIFDLDLPVQRIFEAPTVAELAASIEGDLPERGVGSGSAEDASIEEALKLVENLSDEEVEALLAEAEASYESEASRG